MLKRVIDYYLFYFFQVSDPNLCGYISSVLDQVEMIPRILISIWLYFMLIPSGILLLVGKPKLSFLPMGSFIQKFFLVLIAYGK